MDKPSNPEPKRPSRVWHARHDYESAVYILGRMFLDQYGNVPHVVPEVLQADLRKALAAEDALARAEGSAPGRSHSNE